MSGGLNRIRAAMPEGVAPTLVARVVDADGSVIVDGDLYDAGPNFDSPALNTWCLNVYDLASDTPNHNVYEDQLEIVWDAGQTGAFEVGEVVLGQTSGNGGTVLSVTNGNPGVMILTDLTGSSTPTSTERLTGSTSGAVLLEEVYQFTYGTGAGGPLTVADTITETAPGSTSTGDVLAFSGTSAGTIWYQLTSAGDNFLSGDSVLASPSGFTCVTTGNGLADRAHDYRVRRCGAGVSDSDPENLYPIVALTNDGFWDIDNTGYNFSLRVNPGNIVDTDDDGDTVTGWRGGHTYRIEVSLALGSINAPLNNSTTGGVVAVSFEIQVDPTTSQSAL